jgi:hypothetical protein
VSAPLCLRVRGFVLKIDFKKKLKDLYSASSMPAIVDIPEMAFLAVDGFGDPNTSQEYREAIEALYAVSYSLKFAIRKTHDVDYGVMPLEGLWWAEDMTTFATGRKDLWQWTAMIMQPDYVTADMVSKTKTEVAKKKELPALTKMQLVRFHEGRVAQIIHIGPYADEAPTIKKLHDFVAASGLGLSGKHHEIYLGDPNRAAPERLKTIIRQPVS